MSFSVSLSRMNSGLTSSPRFTGLNRELKKLRGAALEPLDMHTLSPEELIQHLNSHAARMQGIKDSQPTTEQLLRNTEEIIAGGDEVYRRAMCQMGEDFEIQVAQGNANRTRLRELEEQLAHRLQGMSLPEVKRMMSLVEAAEYYTPTYDGPVTATFCSRIQPDN